MHKHFIPIPNKRQALMKPNLWLVFALINVMGTACPAMAQNLPLTLQEGLRIVTEDSRVVKIARLSEAMAESDMKIARAALLPTISASASHTSLAHTPTSVLNGAEVETAVADYYAYSISIQQILFDFRGNLSRYDASRMMLEAKKHDTTRIRNAMALDFTRFFYDYLESQRLVETTAKEIERLEAHLQNAARLYEGGVITRNDLLQVQVRLSDARQKHLSAKNGQALCAAKLNNLLSRPIYASVLAVDTGAIIAAPAPYDAEEFWKQASTLRAEILIVDHTLDAVDFETKMYKAEFLPKFYVRGSNDYMENPHQRYENNWSLMFGVNINLFEGGRALANVQKSQSQKKQLLEQRARLADEIRMELQYHSLHLQNAYARIQVSQDAAGQAQENLRINKKRYEQGIGTATEVLDAVTLLTLAETNQIQAVYDYRRAEAALHYATGRNLLDIYR
jgi:outer membrane protein TolC